MPSSSDSVKVAVRVRPFNQREKNAGSECIISMSGTSTIIANPENGEKKTFSFDHSYWSHDGYHENAQGVSVPESSASTYADQRQVFQDLGRGVLENAWQGYNAALFAYGQTGAGKSYSMIGYGPNKGIVPITCEELFKAIESNQDKSKQLQVSFSMIEIYNEQVRDLLVKSKQPPAGGLKIRENPQIGFYVEGLKEVPVRNYTEIENLMEQGTVNRTTASTNMNATSSRSHMVITIKFAQIYKAADGKSNTRSSNINLVDLAGSERAASTGATGDRFKEGTAINKSLSTLGNVISALADIALGKKVKVPYRDSVLTKLLQTALGGNSRTIMIAALSPSAINYAETLSTLRYADRAKKIQNKAVVNESPTDRLIRQLKEENARLLKMIQGGGKGMVDTEEELKRMMEENEKRMGEMNMTWEQRLEKARMEWEKSLTSVEKKEAEEWEKTPYITNINEDPQLSGVIRHCIHKGQLDIGKTVQKENGVQIKGLGIQNKHAIIYNNGKDCFIEPICKNSQVYHCGHRIKEKIKLSHLDRIKLGSNCFFLYVGFPKQRSSSNSLEHYDHDFFMMELAEHEGVAFDLQTPRAHESTNDIITTMVLQEYMDIMPLVSEANAISEEMNKNVKFEAEIKNEACHDPEGKSNKKEIIIKVTNVETRKVWIWSKAKFEHRKDLIDEMYNKFCQGASVKVAKEKDPFWDPVEDIFLGSCHILLQCLSYCIDIDEHFALHNYHGKEEAVTHVQILPTDPLGHTLGGDEILEPEELIGHPLHLTIKFPQFMGSRWVKEDGSRGVFLKYQFHTHKQLHTDVLVGKSVGEFDYVKQFTYPKVTEDFLEYLQKQSLVLEMWGTQVDAVVAMNGHHKEEDPKSEEISRLKMREQILSEEKDELKKENFKLKKSLETQKQAITLAKARRNSLTTDSDKMEAGLDKELAIALKVFFKDVRGVQNQLKAMKEFTAESIQDPRENGNLRTALKKQEQNLSDIDKNLSSCVQNLKQTVVNKLKKVTS